MVHGEQVRTRGFVGFADLDELQRSWERRAGRAADRRQAERPRAPEPVDSRELCHDLRQPLATASALAVGLAGEEGLGAAGRDRLRLLEQQLHRLSAMVDAALVPAPQVLVGLTGVAREVCAGQAVTASGLELVVTDEPVVVGEPVQLARLLDNLLTNARRAAGPEGRVRLVVGVAHGQALLQVDDAGGATGGGPSTGLGLLVVSGVAARHGGVVETGTSELGGLSVRVLLPLALPVQPAAGPS